MAAHGESVPFATATSSFSISDHSLSLPSTHSSHTPHTIITTTAAAGGASLPASLAIAAALDVAARAPSSSSSVPSDNGLPPDSIAINVAPSITLSGSGSSRSGAESKEDSKRGSSGDARDLVLTLCPIKSSGERPPAVCGHSTSLIASRMFLYGGAADYGRLLSDLYTTDVSVLQWEKLSSTGTQPPCLFGHSSVILKRAMLMFGGLTQRRGDDSKERKEPRSPSSPSSGISGFAPSTMGSSPKRLGGSGRSSGAAAARMKLFNNESTLPTNTLYSLATDTLIWSIIKCSGVAPPPLYMHSMCLVGTSIVIFGGCYKPGYRSSTADLYILDTERWSWSKPEIRGGGPTARHGHSATAISDTRMLVFGGAGEDEEGQLVRYNSVHIFDIKTLTWSTPTIAGSPPLPRAFHSAGVITNAGRLLHIFAGETTQVSSDLCVLNLDTMKWARPLFDGSFEHEMHSSVVVSDKLLVFGGLSQLGLVDDFFFINTVTIRAGVTENDHTFKLVLVGDSSVGKSCLMTRFVEDRFSEIHLSTIGVDFKTVTTMLDGKIVKLHIWDTAGQERFAQVTTHYYRGADGAILVYDTTNAQSFESIENWVEAVKNANSQPVVMLLVGNKNDLVEERQVSRQSGEELAASLNAPFMETSARDSCNVDVTFLNLAKTLVNTRKGQRRPGRGMQLDSISSAESSTQKGCCR